MGKRVRRLIFSQFLTNLIYPTYLSIFDYNAFSQPTFLQRYQNIGSSTFENGHARTFWGYT